MRKVFATLFLAAVCLSCGTTQQIYQASQPSEDETANIGYGEIDRKNSTFSTNKLNMRPNDAAVYTDMYEYLRGRVPGVAVGTDNSITIRGVNSINLSTEPLILLDGVAITDLSTINPMDVQSVDVLKDASSSIYGARGANGVILITTKH